MAQRQVAGPPRRQRPDRRLQPNTFFPVPASVVFARRGGVTSRRRPLAGIVERWDGKAGADDVQRVAAVIIDTDARGRSPYERRFRQGATIGPRCLFFVNEIENPTLVQAGQTVTVNPRRGSQDKEPWKNLDLTAITGQTVESAHLFDVHLWETLVPYAILDPLKALLPLRQGESAIPVDTNGVGRVRLGGLDRRMRGRWSIITELWETNKSTARQLNLVERLDYHREMSSQMGRQRNSGNRPIRMTYTTAGQPTAALQEQSAVITERLYWISCKDVQRQIRGTGSAQAPMEATHP